MLNLREKIEALDIYDEQYHTKVLQLLIPAILAFKNETEERHLEAISRISLDNNELQQIVYTFNAFKTELDDILSQANKHTFTESNIDAIQQGDNSLSLLSLFAANLSQMYASFDSRNIVRDNATLKKMLDDHIKTMIVDPIAQRILSNIQTITQSAAGLEAKQLTSFNTAERLEDISLKKDAMISPRKLDRIKTLLMHAQDLGIPIQASTQKKLKLNPKVSNSSTVQSFIRQFTHKKEIAKLANECFQEIIDFREGAHCSKALILRFKFMLSSILPKIEQEQLRPCLRALKTVLKEIEPRGDLIKYVEHIQAETKDAYTSKLEDIITQSFRKEERQSPISHSSHR